MNQEQKKIRSSFFAKKFLDDIPLREEFSEKLSEVSHKGKVVYVMERASFLDSVILKHILKKYNFAIPVWANNLTPILTLPFYKIYELIKTVLGKGSKEDKVLERVSTILRNKDSSFIYFIKKSASIFYTGDEYSLKIPAEIIRRVKKIEDDIILLPVGIYYERKAKKEGSKNVSSLYTGVWSRFYSFFKKHNSTIISFGDPINIKEFLDEGATQDLVSESNRLRERLLDILHKDQEILRGPDIIDRRRVIESILKEKSLNDSIKEIAKSEGRTYEATKRDAYKVLNKMVADHNERVITIAVKVFGALLPRLFKKIHVDKNFGRIIRESIKSAPTVLVPNHRSYLDSFLIARVLYENNVALPYIASGINLNFWPFGNLARKAKTYFIRRRIKGDKLYGKALGSYIEYLLKMGHTQKIFIEGTRSRSGKQLFPKTGLLSMINEAKTKGVCKDINFVPISITYESILESKSLTKEAAGQEKKKKESFLRFLKARNLLKRKYGATYVSANNLISLNNFEKENARACHDPKELVRLLSFYLSKSISEVATITVSSIIGTVLLAKKKRAVEFSDIKKRAGFLVELLRSNSSIRISDDLKDINKVATDSLEAFKNMRSIEDCIDGKERFYSVKYNKRFALDYYKNNNIHFFSSYSILARILLSREYGYKPLDEIFNIFAHVINLFSYEFFTLTTISNDELFKMLKELSDLGLFEIKDQKTIQINEKNKSLLKMLSMITVNYFEAYWGVFETLKKNPTIINQENSAEEIHQQIKIMYFKGDIERTEAVSKPIITSAINKIKIESARGDFEKLIEYNSKLLKNLIC